MITDATVEAAARAIARMRGGKFAGPGQSFASREFGWRGDGWHLDKYADAHWIEHEDEARAALEAAEAARGPHWRHKKRGTEYVEVGRGWLQTDRPLTDNEPVVAYQSTKAASMFWVRPVDEFEDGRFEPAATETTAPCPP